MQKKTVTSSELARDYINANEAEGFSLDPFDVYIPRQQKLETLQ